MSRAELARRQAELLHALLADGPAPAGFDASRLRVEANVLRRKGGAFTLVATMPEDPSLN